MQKQNSELQGKSKEQIYLQKEKKADYVAKTLERILRGKRRRTKTYRAYNHNARTLDKQSI